MGYTHYFARYVAPEHDSKWPEAKMDILKLIGKASELFGVDISVVVRREGITFNGIGEESYEPFAWGVSQFSSAFFCKTAHMPYDVVVAATLLRLTELYGDGVVNLSSDGYRDNAGWRTACALYRATFQMEPPYVARMRKLSPPDPFAAKRSAEVQTWADESSSDVPSEKEVPPKEKEMTMGEVLGAMVAKEKTREDMEKAMDAIGSPPKKARKTAPWIVRANPDLGKK